MGLVYSFVKILLLFVRNLAFSTLSPAHARAGGRARAWARGRRRATRSEKEPRQKWKMFGNFCQPLKNNRLPGFFYFLVLG